MKKSLFLLCVIATSTVTMAATSVTRHHITWTFDRDHTVGQFVNGDPWVVGPVKIIFITNDISDMSFMPEDYAVSGSEVNPVVDKANNLRQGFDERLQGYVPELNVSRPNGRPLSKDNPLLLAPGSSLLSTVSWLWRSPTEKEKGTPRVPDIDPKKGHTRPTLRTAAVLTVLDKAPPEGSFRPAYSGTDKTIKFNIKDVHFDRLLKLDPLPSVMAKHVPSAALHDMETLRPNYAPWREGDPELTGIISVDSLARLTERVFLDHIPAWYGGEAFHPSDNLPNYGREITTILQQAMLSLHLDWDKFPEKPKKERLAINLIQIGIDLTGMADNGTFWPADGGHDHGRKPAILFAGLLLDDPHMKNVGNWDVRFQDCEQTFYVEQKHIDGCKTAIWAEESKRGGGIYPVLPYTEEMIGMPEWGVQPVRDLYNSGWNVAYREINAGAIPGFALALMMMEDGRKLFNHEAYFDYADRINSSGRPLSNNNFNPPPKFAHDMWLAYRDKYPSTYDKKWDDQKILDYITTENFMMRPAPVRWGTFALDEPVRIKLGHAVKVGALKPESVIVILKDEPVKVVAIESDGETSDQFVIKFADGALKPDETYTVTLDEAATADWRDSLGRPLMGNTATFKTRQ